VPPKPSPIDFTSAPNNVIYHSDLSQYSFYNLDSAFAAAVGELLDIGPDNDAWTMERAAAAVLQQSGDDSLC
jgi:hypothetical protein